MLLSSLTILETRSALIACISLIWVFDISFSSAQIEVGTSSSCSFYNSPLDIETSLSDSSKILIWEFSHTIHFMLILDLVHFNILRSVRCYIALWNAVSYMMNIVWIRCREEGNVLILQQTHVPMNPLVQDRDLLDPNLVGEIFLSKKVITVHMKTVHDTMHLTGNYCDLLIFVSFVPAHQ